MQHIIKKQIIELSLDSNQNAFKIQNEMSSFYWKKIVPELESVFDELSGKKDFIQIDKLELELGLFKEEHFASTHSLTEICPGINSKIKEEVLLQLKKGKPAEAPGIAAQWLYYMEKGYLNWNTISIDESWNQKVLETFAADYSGVSLLRKLISQSEKAVQRIANRHDEIFLKRLTEVLTAEKQDQLVDLVNELHELLKEINSLQRKSTAFDLSRIRKKIWGKIISIAASGKEKLSSGEIASAIIRWITGEGAEMTWLSAAKEHGNSWLHQLIKEINFQKPVTSKQKDKTVKPHLDELLNQVTGREKDINTQHDSEVNEEGIFVDNAGIVLLHPFFNSLFNRLNLISDGKFVDDASQQKALHLLYWLATGNEAPEEYELVIPKFLIGYPLEDVISSLKLTNEEKQEADYLLEAAIEKWNILGNSSPLTLRESFLQRKGKLYSKNENHYLQVETSSIDVLLDHLPWNLSIIKLPWMRDMLRVEWR